MNGWSLIGGGSQSQGWSFIPETGSEERGNDLVELNARARVRNYRVKSDDGWSLMGGSAGGLGFRNVKSEQDERGNYSEEMNGRVPGSKIYCIAVELVVDREGGWVAGSGLAFYPRIIR